MLGNQHELNQKSNKIWYLLAAIGVIIVIAIGAILIQRNIKTKNYKVYINDAEKYAREQNYEKAIIAYESAIKVNKKQIRPYEGLGEVYIQTKQYTKARIVLREGYEITGSARLNQMYLKLDGLVDGEGTDDVAIDGLVSGEGSNGLWNDSLIAEIASATFDRWNKEYGSGQSSFQGEQYQVKYSALNATVYYKNTSSKNILDTASGTPYSGAIPTYIVFHDLTTVFYEIADGMAYDTIASVIGTQPEIKPNKNGWQIVFQYLECEFKISCDENGNIKDQYAENEVIPLLEGSSKAVGAAEGSIVDATTGNPLPGVTISLVSDTNGQVAATSVSDDSGNFSIEAEKGSYTMTFELDGYVTESSSVSINTNLTETVGVKAMSPELEGGEWRIVLEWGGEPRDLDAHLVTDSYHVSFMNPSASSGNDNSANLDVDDMDGYGPETITISSFKRSEHYRFFVHDFTNGNKSDSTKLASSGATVKVYLPNGELMQYSVPSGSGTVWNVFEIENGQISEIGTITSDLSRISK